MTSICRIAAIGGLCVGCHRTLDEIAAWSAMTASDKQVVLDAIVDRVNTADTDVARSGPTGTETPQT